MKNREIQTHGLADLKRYALEIILIQQQTTNNKQTMNEEIKNAIKMLEEYGISTYTITSIKNEIRKKDVTPILEEYKAKIGHTYGPYLTTYGDNQVKIVYDL